MAIRHLKENVNTMANANNVKEITVEFENKTINISEAGIWIDTVDGEGQPISMAVAWEELPSHEANSFMSLYEVLHNSDLPALRKAG
jgi:hypothetical protein